MPHWAQVVYPCWSWFAEKRAKNCIFLVKDGLSSGWFSFMAERMGCLVIHKQPKMCTVLGLLDKRISAIYLFLIQVIGIPPDSIINGSKNLLG
jgi:hypothetical protein